jgi:hypothetical protein
MTLMSGFMLVQGTYKCIYCKEKFKGFHHNGITIKYDIGKKHVLFGVPICKRCKKYMGHMVLNWKTLEKLKNDLDTSTSLYCQECQLIFEARI